MNSALSPSTIDHSEVAGCQYSVVTPQVLIISILSITEYSEVVSGQYSVETQRP